MKMIKILIFVFIAMVAVISAAFFAVFNTKKEMERLYEGKEGEDRE